MDGRMPGAFCAGRLPTSRGMKRGPNPPDARSLHLRFASRGVADIAGVCVFPKSVAQAGAGHLDELGTGGACRCGRWGIVYSSGVRGNRAPLFGAAGQVADVFPIAPWAQRRRFARVPYRAGSWLDPQAVAQLFEKIVEPVASGRNWALDEAARTICGRSNRPAALCGRRRGLSRRPISFAFGEVNCMGPKSP